ncbi:hypothetical protein Hanom_Chr06g00568931 [Helianthus anomalus]
MLSLLLLKEFGHDPTTDSPVLFLLHAASNTPVGLFGIDVNVPLLKLIVQSPSFNNSMHLRTLSCTDKKELRIFQCYLKELK